MEKVKRRKKKYDPYTLEMNHMISFIDSKGVKQNISLNEELYQEFNAFELEDLKELNEYDRHIEHLELTEDNLYHYTKNKYVSLEEFVFEKLLYEKLHQEINKLPEIQKRRLKMYYLEGKNLREIALIEHCSPRAVKYSIDIALQKLSKKISI